MKNFSERETNPFEEGDGEGGIDRSRIFKDTGVDLPNRALRTSKGRTQFRVCDICYGTTFTTLEGGYMKCKKCGQVYYR
jgi:hypothetical protein